MKKKIWMPIAAAVVMAAALFVPIPISPMKDGGTREYRALTYKVIDWNRYFENGVDQSVNKYDKTCVYFFPDNFRSSEELWEREAEKAECSFSGTVVELSGNTVIVEPFGENSVSHSADKISFGTDKLEDIGADVGSIVEVTFVGGVGETYPGQINAVSWKICTDMRDREYTEKWIEIDRDVLTEYYKTEEDLVITSIYANCFFAEYVVPMPLEFKINGKLSDEWCVGDQVLVTFENYVYDDETNREEADLVSVEKSTFEIDPNMCYKPVIYLYPEKETEVSVKLTIDGDLTCTYPEYNDGWSVMASPDGTLTDKSGKEYNYLYWEGETFAQYDFSKSFCVKGEDTAAFLENALEKLGLTRREANEFIVYWLPLMQDNPYNVISFQTDVYTDAAKLDITPAPDTLIRVFMAWYGADSYTELEAQKLDLPARNGFTVVEWGGTQVK